MPSDLPLIGMTARIASFTAVGSWMSDSGPERASGTRVKCAGPGALGAWGGTCGRSEQAPVPSGRIWAVANDTLEVALVAYGSRRSWVSPALAHGDGRQVLCPR